MKNIKRISPLTWQHNNFYGQYQFDWEMELLNLRAMASKITDSGVLP